MEEHAEVAVAAEEEDKIFFLEEECAAVVDLSFIESARDDETQPRA